MNEKAGNPFKIGDVVMYTPDRHTRGWVQEHPKFGIKQNRVYRIEEIRNSDYLCFFRDDNGTYYSNFRPASDQERDRLEVPLPFPSRDQRVAERLQKMGVQIGDKVIFHPKEADKMAIIDWGGTPLKANSDYTVTGFDPEALGFFLAEVQLGDRAFPAGWFRKAGDVDQNIE